MRSILALSLATVVTASGKPNPIRRVITMLEEMKKEIGEERDNAARAWEKWQCFYKKKVDTLEASIAKNKKIIEEQAAAAERFAAAKEQAAADMASAQAEKEETEVALAAAKKKRAEDKAEFTAAYEECEINHVACDGAVDALARGYRGQFANGSEPSSDTYGYNQEEYDPTSKGVLVDTVSQQRLPSHEYRGFLQSSASKTKQLLEKITSSPSADKYLDISARQLIESFLQYQPQGYTPASQQIIGILQTMSENMKSENAERKENEEIQAKAHRDYVMNAEQVIKTATNTMMEKNAEKGEMAVGEANALAAVKLATVTLENDTAELNDLNATQKQKEKDFNDAQKSRSEEIDAISAALDVLSSDDALDLFRKTDTRPAFVQLSLLQVSKKSIKKKALVKTLESIQSRTNSSPALALLAFSTRQALGQKKVNFDKIIRMIDDMVVLLKQDDKDDLEARDLCVSDLQAAALEKKDIDHELKQEEAAIDKFERTIMIKKQTIEECDEVIKRNEKELQSAGEQRTEENKQFMDDLDLNKQAVQLLLKAKDKLAAHYSPGSVEKKYTEETTEEAVSRMKHEFLQQPEPEGPAAYNSKGGKGSNVMALIMGIANDIRKDSAVLETEEKNAQLGYEQLVKDTNQSTKDRISAKNAAQSDLADAELGLGESKATHKALTKDSTDLEEYTSKRKASCDFIIKNLDSRLSQRATEREGLLQAKAILSGADFGEE